MVSPNYLRKERLFQSWASKSSAHEKTLSMWSSKPNQNGIRTSRSLISSVIVMSGMERPNSRPAGDECNGI